MSIPFPPSAIRAMAAAFGPASDGPVPGRSRYVVTLRRPCDGRTTTFGTSVFDGPGRVDLEDACAWGFYDQVLLRRRKGAFAPDEVRRILGEIVYDLTYDHPLQFIEMQALPDAILLDITHDFDSHHMQWGPRLRRRLVHALDLSGWRPEVVEETASWFLVAVAPTRTRQRLAMARRSRGFGAARLARAHPGARELLRPRDDRDGDGWNEEGPLEFRELLRELHRRRVEQVAGQFERRKSSR